MFYSRLPIAQMRMPRFREGEWAQATLRHALRGIWTTFEREIIRAVWFCINNMKILCQSIHLQEAIRSPTMGQELGGKPKARFGD